jgi:hypothetical protein
VCFHPSLGAVRAAERAAERGPAFREHVCRILDREGHATPHGAMEVSASGLVRDGQGLPDSVTVYHLLYVPFATAATVGIPDQAPGSGARGCTRPGPARHTSCGRSVARCVRRLSRAQGKRGQSRKTPREGIAP